ncbi:rod shape-determining protein MreC [Nitratidesulfovibrio termitidis]|uniref:rod shape-determining protein MreC n=1 Tax=Nitratidesulfovibrio termitidis TaxID=42252 RepID=UPI0004031FD9|nr:rod shape-determining protein MreC [Nitratidesulfovibrio termitidis]
MLDRLAEHAGLEFVGAILKPGVWARDQVVSSWNNYLDLVGVREENEALREQVRTLSQQVQVASEARAELARLRALLELEPPEGWRPLGARVVANRLGPQAALESAIISRGYYSGAGPGTPVVTHEGVVGRVYRAGPYTATVLLLTDPGSRIAVLSATNRTAGILVGTGPRGLLEMKYVPQNARIEVGELVLTSGLEGAFPKAVLVARVESVSQSDLSLFQTVYASPLADLEALEEVLLLERPPVQPGAHTPPLPAVNATQGGGPGAGHGPGQGNATSGHGGQRVQPVLPAQPVQSGQQGARAPRPQPSAQPTAQPSGQQSGQQSGQPPAQQPGQSPRQ